ncbi:hypothetical protein B0T24DRAFT_679992 [Lasiosphaeria ovina]|uniref:Uncharacterized protein n=1 Tax=Lasiosphaeria ovina TaxID=92902 RepID=A0AAE0N5E5_9PEZI|nr:hypothetical protein B0T24DRAFT_679992 [Lasiosphaeria ovina]
MALPLRVIVPATVVCALYTVCRVYFYVEDFMSLRVQPVGIFVTANQAGRFRFDQFLGGGYFND